MEARALGIIQLAAEVSSKVDLDGGGGELMGMIRHMFAVRKAHRDPQERF